MQYSTVHCGTLTILYHICLTNCTVIWLTASYSTLHNTDTSASVTVQCRIVRYSTLTILYHICLTNCTFIWLTAPYRTLNKTDTSVSLTVSYRFVSWSTVACTILSHLVYKVYHSDISASVIVAYLPTYLPTHPPTYLPYSTLLCHICITNSTVE